MKANPAIKAASTKASRTKRPSANGAAANALKDMRFVLSADGHFIYASPGFAAAMDLPEDGMANIQAGTVLRFAPTDDYDDDRDFLKLHGEAQPQDFVKIMQAGPHTLICGDKDTRLDFQFDWVRGPDGKAYMVASAGQTDGVPQRDVDMKKLVTQIIENPATNTQLPEPDALGASAALRVEELRQFLEMSDDMMCSTHPDGGIIRFNPAFTTVLGYEPQDMIGKQFSDFIDPADRAEMRAAFYGLCQFESNAPFIRIECRMMTASGESRETRWSVRLQNGVFYCLGHDVTEDKTHEAALLRRDQQLSEAQALAHMGHWRWEVGADSIEWSDELYNIFGVKRGDFIPAMDSINALIHRRDLGRLFQAFQRAIIQQNDYDMDFRAIRPDGVVRTIRCEGRCELDSEGEVIALYGIMQDITPQKDHEKALRDAKDAAENAYASKSRFLANMSHELRTPLNAIIGFSDLIEKQMLGPLGNERYLDYIGAIRESGHHLLDLITDILDMSKIEAGKYELTLEKVNISQTIRTVVQMMEARASEGGLELICELPKDDITIRADRRALKQIFLNLLSNAVKFTETNGTVDVRLMQDDSHVAVEVRDSGIGIPAHKLADVTKPFEQVSNAFTRNHEGSGLGLAITKDLTELHKGTLSIDSRLGQGTSVIVRLPKA